MLVPDHTFQCRSAHPRASSSDRMVIVVPLLPQQWHMERHMRYSDVSGGKLAVDRRYDEVPFPHDKQMRKGRWIIPGIRMLVLQGRFAGGTCGHCANTVWDSV